MDRDRWLGFRWQGHGLGGDAGKEALDELLQLGFQGSRLGGAEQSLIQRAKKIGSTSVTKAIGPDGPLVTMWSVRGAPHTHRVTQLDFIRDALAPRESDEGGASYVAAVQEVASALYAVVKGPTSKGDASRGVADRVSASLVQWCARCKADHVPDGLFRAAGRQAQVVLGPEEQRATMLYPTPKQRQEKVKDPRAELVRRPTSASTGRPPGTSSATGAKVMRRRSARCGRSWATSWSGCRSTASGTTCRSRS